MNKLERMQQYANKIADKLNTDARPILRWANAQCNTSRHAYAHCHTGEYKGLPRGTMCINRKNMANRSAREWHHTIAHEVSHLAVKSNHWSITFARTMLKIGVANHDEQSLVKAHKRHKHIYSVIVVRNGCKKFYCHYCRKQKP